MILIAAEAQTNPDQIPIIWSWLGGPVVGAAVVTGAYALIKSYMDKKVSPHDDVITKTALIIEGLETVVTVLKEDKKRDTERIDSLQNRIDTMEESAQADYNYIIQLQREMYELQLDISDKNHKIQQLEHEIDKVKSGYFTDEDYL